MKLGPADLFPCARDQISHTDRDIRSLGLEMPKFAQMYFFTLHVPSVLDSVRLLPGQSCLSCSNRDNVLVLKVETGGRLQYVSMTYSSSLEESSPAPCVCF